METRGKCGNKRTSGQAKADEVPGMSTINRIGRGYIMARRRSGYNIIIGGNIDDVPRPYVRKFPDGRRRRSVRVRVSRFVVGIGRGHFHISVSEEDNPLWDDSAGCWRSPWDDSTSAGKYLYSKFRTDQQCRKWINNKVRKIFPPKTHRLLVNDLPVERWLYKDGD